MLKTQINKYIKHWNDAPRVKIEEDSNAIDICMFIKEHFGKETVIVEIPECSNADIAWLFGKFFAEQNIANILTMYACSHTELPTTELSPYIFFSGIPFNYIVLNGKVYLNDDDTGERIILNEYL